MEFLYKLYSNDYFGIGLFVVITILAFSFLVILFFGKKDEKARNAQEIKTEESKNLAVSDNIENQNLNSSEDMKTDSLGTMSTNMSANTNLEDVSQPIIEEKTPESEPMIDPFAMPNTLIDDLNKIDESPVLNQLDSKDSVEQSNISNNIFDAPKPENIVISPEINETFEEPLFNSTMKETPLNTTQTPIIEEPVSNDIFSAPKEDILKKAPMPNQFSSVYLPNESLPKEEKEESVATITPLPLKPDFSLPKSFDMPKLNKSNGESSTINTEIIKTDSQSAPNNNLSDVLGKIEENSFKINE